MAFSLTLPSFAVSEEDQKLSTAEVEQALNTALAALVDAPDGATVVADNSLVDEATRTADTPREVSGLLSGLIFIEKDKAESVASYIVENSKYTVKVIADGKQTVYCSIDFEKFPEIYDARVYLAAIDKIKDKCDEVAKKNGIDINGTGYSPMSYKHIAGELALHMILTDLSKDSKSWNPISAWFYERSSIADLNVDEDRIPAFLLEMLGDAIVNLFKLIVSTAG